MADMDLDDLDLPSQLPTRAPGRYAPKGSKLQPKPKPKHKTEEPTSSSSSTVQLKEEFDSIPPVELNAAGDAKTEPYDLPSVDDNAVAMDIDARAGEKEDDDATEMGGEEEDQVVREIDVYYTPSIDNETKLYVLQYPLRPMWRPYELDERCEEVRVKPGSGELEVDLSLNADSKNYDAGADPGIRITKQTLSSSWRLPARTGYAIGILSGNKLYLNPIHAVVQLRPSLRYLKGLNEEIEEEKATMASKKQIKMPGASSKHNKVIEEWVPLQYHGARSDISVRYLRQMMEEESFTIQFSISPNDYLSSLCPSTSNHNHKSKGPLRRSLLPLPIEERYNILLVKGGLVHRFCTLLHYLAPDESVGDLLRVLQKYAVLVQGHWVPKSALLFEKDDQLKTYARDKILLLFRNSPRISNTELSSCSQQVANAMKEVLNVLAVERPILNDWKFKESPDSTSMKLPLEILREQELYWERLEYQISEVEQSRTRPGMKNASKSNKNPHATLRTSDKVVSKTPNGSLSMKPMAKETREAFRKALQKVLQHHKVCSFQQICQHLRAMAVSESSRPKGFARELVDAANGVEHPELREEINKVAVNINEVYVLRELPDYQHNDLRKIVIDLLIAKGGRDAKLKKADVVAAAKLDLQRDINNNEFQKVIQELCVSKGSAWVLKSGDGNPK